MSERTAIGQKIMREAVLNDKLCKDIFWQKIFIDGNPFLSFRDANFNHFVWDRDN